MNTEDKGKIKVIYVNILHNILILILIISSYIFLIIHLNPFFMGRRIG